MALHGGITEKWLIILLRSEAFVALGLKMLKSYADRDEDDVYTLEKIMITVLSVIVSFMLTYWFVYPEWLDYQGWALFWRSALIGVVTLLGEKLAMSNN